MKRLLFAVFLAAWTLAAMVPPDRPQSPNPHCPLLFGVVIPPDGNVPPIYFLPPFDAKCFVDHGEAQLEVTEVFVHITGKPGVRVDVRCRERRSDEAK